MYPRSKKRPRKGERSVAVERPEPADVERAEEAPLIPAAQLAPPPTSVPGAAPAATQAAPLMPRTVAAPTVYAAQGSPVSTSYVSYVRGGMPAPTGVRFGVSPAPAAAPAAAAHTVSHGAQAGIAGPAEQAVTASTMALFDALDANGDGVLDAAELAQLKMGGPPARPALPSEPVASMTRLPPVLALVATRHATFVGALGASLQIQQARSSEHLELWCSGSHCMWQHRAQFENQHRNLWRSRAKVYLTWRGRPSPLKGGPLICQHLLRLSCYVSV